MKSEWKFNQRSWNKKHKNLILHKGKKTKYEEIKEKLLEYIIININVKNPLTIWSVVSYYDKFLLESSGGNYKAKYHRIYRFIKKYGFYIRKPTRQGHLFPIDFHIKIISYLKDLFELRKKSVKDISLIICMDEAHIFFTPTLNRVIANKGVKQVVISTEGQEKQRVTLVLKIAGNGAKLKPYFIFYGNSNSENLYNRIN